MTIIKSKYFIDQQIINIHCQGKIKLHNNNNVKGNLEKFKLLGFDLSFSSWSHGNYF